MRKVLITGATGFAGSFLTEYLTSLSDFEVFGTYVSDESLKNVSDFKDKANYIKLDLLENEEVEKAIKEIKPDLVFHLAAMSSPGKSFSEPSQTIMNNVNSEINLLEAMREHSKDAKILIVSSADVYGIVTSENLPIDEETPLNPANPYAVSKIAQDYLGLEYFNVYKLNIVRARPFNHIGPRQSLGFVVSDFAKRIVDIEKGKTAPVLKVGNLSAKKDFTDVRDMVRAYALVLEKGKLGEVYNIGSGICHSIEEIVEMMRNISKAKFELEKDEELFRPSENPELIADTAKLRSVIDWRPEISLEKTLEDTINYWRNFE